jgi:hypothetical protein
VKVGKSQIKGLKKEILADLIFRIVMFLNILTVSTLFDVILESHILCLYFSTRLVVSDQWLHCRYGFWILVRLSEEIVRQSPLCLFGDEISVQSRFLKKERSQWMTYAFLVVN